MKRVEANDPMAFCAAWPMRATKRGTTWTPLNI